MRYIFNPSTGNLETADNVTSPLKPLGDKFKLAELPRHLWNNMNTPDLEQSPDSFLKPGETLEEWDETFRRPNAKGGLQRQGYLLPGLVLTPQIVSAVAVGLGITAEAARRYINNNPQIVKAAEGGIDKVKEFFSFNKKKQEPSKEVVKDKQIDWSLSYKDKEPKPPKDPDQEPPEGEPDLLPELTKHTVEEVIRKQIKEKDDHSKDEEVIRKIKKTYAETRTRDQPPGIREKIKKIRDKKFVDKVKNILDTQYEGNLTKLAKDLNVDRATLFGDFNRHGIDTKTIGAKTIQQFNLGGKKLALKDVTDLAKKDAQYLINTAKNKLGKDYNKSKNKYVNLKDLAETMGIELYKTDGTVDTTAVGDLIVRLNRTDKTFGLKRKKGLDGTTNYYKLEDTIKKFQKHNLSKRVIGDSGAQIKNRYNFIRKQDPTGSLVRDNLTTQIRNRVIKLFGKETIKYAGEHIGHSESVANQIQFKKLYKGSNVGDISTLVFQDPIVNKYFLQKFDLKGEKGTEQLRKKYLNILEDLIGKDFNQLTKKIAQDAVDGLNNLNKEVRERISEAAKEIPILEGQENRIADFKLTLPEKGEKFKSGMLNIDMTNIDPAISVGKILEINPNAKTYEDLTEEQKTLYKENFKNQMADYLTYFYEESKFDTEDLLENLEDLEPTKKYATGGPVVPTIPYRENFEDGSEPEKKMSEAEILESIRKGVFEFEQNWNTEKSIPGKVLDVADVTNWPYYAARMLRAGMTVVEISAKLPFVSMELLGKLATQPAFKVVDAPPVDTDMDPVAEIGLKEKFNEGMTESWLTDQPHKTLEGTGLFTEAFHKLMPGTLADKTGLNSLIESQEQGQQDRGMSQWPEIAGKNIEMGLDITLPFGYVAAAQKYKALKKLLTSVSKDKNVNKVIEKALTDKGMSRRQFNMLIATGGIVATLKSLGIDSLFKGTRLAKDLKTVPIKMLKNTSTKMPPWFPKFIQEIDKKMIYEGKGMWTFKGTDDFLPGFHIERIGDDYYITGKNDYGQEFQVTYETPRWEGDGAEKHYYEGEFRVDDAEPVHVDPDGNMDFDGILRDDIDEVLGGTTAMENVATKTTRKSLTKGEEKVLDAEGRAQSNYDMAKDEGYFDDVE